MDWGIFWTAAGAIAAIIGVLLKVKDKTKNPQKDSSSPEPTTNRIAEFYSANNKKIHKFITYEDLETHYHQEAKPNSYHKNYYRFYPLYIDVPIGKIESIKQLEFYWEITGISNKAYLKKNRLEDVAELIRALGSEVYIQRSEDGIVEHFGGKPNSAKSWTELAREHPEFFQVIQGDKHPIALATKIQKLKKNRVLSPNIIQTLIDIADKLHDKERQ